MQLQKQYMLSGGALIGTQSTDHRKQLFHSTLLWSNLIWNTVYSSGHHSSKRAVRNRSKFRGGLSGTKLYRKWLKDLAQLVYQNANLGKLNSRLQISQGLSHKRKHGLVFDCPTIEMSSAEGLKVQEQIFRLDMKKHALSHRTVCYMKFSQREMVVRQT